MTIKLSIRQYHQLKYLVESDYPLEACGFIAGSEVRGDKSRVVSNLWSVNNVFDGDKRHHFEIAHKDYLEAEAKVARERIDLLGIYHSHPDQPALASKLDLEAAQPFLSYLIISVVAGRMEDIRSFRLRNDVFIEESVVIE